MKYGKWDGRSVGGKRLLHGNHSVMDNLGKYIYMHYLRIQKALAQVEFEGIFVNNAPVFIQTISYHAPLTSYHKCPAQVLTVSCIYICE